MAEKIVLKAENRKTHGKQVKKLRREGLLPANVFGKALKSFEIQLPLKDFQQTLKKAGETHLIGLSVGGSTHNVLIHDFQLDPVSDKVIHVDFQAVSLKEKITATVPIELIGESPAEKEKTGILVQQLSEIEVEALPTDLPDHFTADISGLATVNSSIYVKDLQFDSSKITISPEALEKIVAKIEPLAAEEVIAPPPTPEVPVEGAVTPGAEPAAETPEASKE